MARQSGGKRKRGRRSNPDTSTSGGEQSILNSHFITDQEGLAEAERELNLFEAPESGDSSSSPSYGIKELSDAARAAAKPTIVKCHDIEIRFPFKPYPSQKDMMDKIVEAIQNKQNALLESPTGSGKSLAILCAALGWLEDEKRKLRTQQEKERAEVESRLKKTLKEIEEDERQRQQSETTSPYFDLDETMDRQAREAAYILRGGAGQDRSITSGASEAAMVNAARNTEPPADCNSNRETNAPSNATSENVIEVLSQSASESSSESDSSSDSGGSAESDDDFQQGRVKRRREVTIEYEQEDDAKKRRSVGGSKLDIDFSKYAYTGEGSSVNMGNGTNSKENPDSKARAKGKAKATGIETPREYFPQLPKIFFCSRTHKQIAQLIRELRTKTPYKPSMTLLGSKTHYCVNRKNKKKDKNEGCQDLLDEGDCIHYRRQEELIKPFLNKVWDMEDIIKDGKKKAACPYYAARSMTKHADIVFCPYNYIVHPQIRKAMEVNIDNAIIIIDEAHNIEDVARDSGGHDITLDTLVAADHQLHDMVERNIKAGACMTLQKLVIPFKKIIDEQVFIESFEGGIAKVGLEKMIKELELFGITQDSILDMERACDKLFKAIRDKTEMEKDIEKIRTSRIPPFRDNLTEQEKRELELFHISTGVLRSLDGLIVVLKRLLFNKGDCMDDYKVVVLKTLVRDWEEQEEEEEVEEDEENKDGDDFAASSASQKKKKKKSRRKTGGSSTNNGPKEVKTLSFWCLNPGVVFRELGWVARSIVLTSGTLSPLDSFASELQTEFRITLEASHVVHDSQVWARAIPYGPSRQNLKGTFQCTRTFEYQDEVGKALERICETVPDGVLCFMPSYTLLDTLRNRWQLTDQWSRLSKIKTIFVEPRKAPTKDFDRMLNEFYATVGSSKDRADGSSLPKNRRERGGGALLLAVFRGKCSEGIDFTDKNCRAVVALSIPYPALMDDKVKLKKEYNDKIGRIPKKITLDYDGHGGRAMPPRSLADMDIPNHSVSEAERVAQEIGVSLERPKEVVRKLLPGQRWYEIQAYRAYNQAIGRCIRHRKDWGAIIFLDSRMQWPQAHQGLSKWIRPLVRIATTFEDGMTDLRQWLTPLLGADDGYWAEMEAQRLEREAFKEEEDQARAAEAARIKQEQEDALRPRETLMTEDGESLLSFCLDNGPGPGPGPSTSASTDINTAYVNNNATFGMVKAEPRTQVFLQFKPIKRDPLTQATLSFKSDASTSTVDISVGTIKPVITQKPVATQSLATTIDATIATTTSTGSSDDRIFQGAATEMVMELDEIEEFSDDEFHDALQQLEDGDVSMGSVYDRMDHTSAARDQQGGVKASSGSILAEMDASLCSMAARESTTLTRNSGTALLSFGSTSSRGNDNSVSFQRSVSSSSLSSRSPGGGPSLTRQFSSGGFERGRSVEMQSPPTTPTGAKRILSFSNDPSLPRPLSFSSPGGASTTSPLKSSAINSQHTQFAPRLSQDAVQVLCKQCNTRLMTSTRRPELKTVFKTVARELVANARRPPLQSTFSRSNSSSSLTSLSTSSSTSTQVVGVVSSSSSGSSSSAAADGIRVLMLAKETILSKDYEKAAALAHDTTGLKWSWQSEGLVFQPVICWTCRSNQIRHPHPPISVDGNGELPFGYEKECGWRGVIVVDIAPRLLSFGSSSGLASPFSTSQTTTTQNLDRQCVGQAWFAIKEIRCV